MPSISRHIRLEVKMTTNRSRARAGGSSSSTSTTGPIMPRPPSTWPTWPSRWRPGVTSATCSAPRAATGRANRRDRVRDSPGSAHPPGPRDVAGQAHTLDADGRLPQLLCPRRGQGPADAPVRCRGDADDAADHRPDRHAAAAAQGNAARLLEHGPASRRQPGAAADVPTQSRGRRPRLAQRPGLSPRRSRGRPWPVHGRSRAR